MNKNKGFTLIELLVVIAIIGILASVVLASLNSARTKAADAAVKANMNSLRAQAEVWYETNGNKYNTTVNTPIDNLSNTTTGVCTGGVFADPVIQNAMTQIRSSMKAGGTMKCTTNAIGQKWAYSISALKGSDKPYCIDNSGYSEEGTVVGTSATVYSPIATAGVCVES